MNRGLFGRTKLILAIPILIIGLATDAPAGSGQIDSLDNGFKIILVESHASPMIASVIFVESGSKYESEYENGITHLLERLLFDGTTNRTREELEASIRDLGGHMDAVTRKDLTAYMVLLPAQYIEHGLTVQADMLFNSVFPETELVKERKVVIEDIRRAADAPGAPAEDFFTEKAYGNTAYGLPVLGYESLIANIPRSAIIDYWRANYTPDKMTALVIGDFDTEAMSETINRIFGSVPSTGPADTPSTLKLHQRLAGTKGRANRIVGEHIFDTVAEVRSAYVNFSIAGPDFSSADYPGFDLLTQYLALDEISPIKKALHGEAEPLASEVSVNLVSRPEFTRLEILAITERPDLCDTIVRTTLASLRTMSSNRVDSADLEGIKTANRCQAIYNAEKLHHYGFMIAPMIMTAGWEGLQDYQDRFDSVTWEQCQAAAETWLASPSYIATIVRPADSAQIPYRATGPTEEQVVAYYDIAVFDGYDSAVGVDLVYPALDSVSTELTDRAVYHREVLDNGLTVIVKSSQDSRVFAVNVLGRNRTANEPEGLAGITDFVNRCLVKGTTRRSAGQLARDLASFGANLILVEDASILYDDRYATRQYASIRFETIERFAPIGFELLTDLVTQPAFDSVEVEDVRSEMLGGSGRDAGLTSRAARDLWFASMFPNHAFARPIAGTPQIIGMIGVDDLRAHHACFYSPQNLIMSIVTSRDTSEVMSWVRSQWGGLPNECDPVSSPAAPETVVAAPSTHMPMAQEQVAIRVGGRLPGADSEEALDLRVAISILGHRLHSNLGEKQVLAHSTGAGAGFDRNFGWYYLSIGTGSDNYDRARDGLILQTEKLAFDGPSSDEVVRAGNQIWGRLMSARMSRINQAYYMGLNEFYDRDIAWEGQLLERLSRVTAASVRKAAARYFRPDLWIEATAGTRP